MGHSVIPVIGVYPEKYGLEYVFLIPARCLTEFG